MDAIELVSDQSDQKKKVIDQPTKDSSHQKKKDDVKTETVSSDELPAAKEPSNDSVVELKETELVEFYFTLLNKIH